MEQYSSPNSVFLGSESTPLLSVVQNSSSVRTYSSDCDTMNSKFITKETRNVNTSTGVDVYTNLLSQIQSTSTSIDLSFITESQIDASGNQVTLKDVKLEETVLQSLSLRIRDMICEEMTNHHTKLSENRSECSEPMTEYVFIPDGECIRLSIEGNIGAGKSELMDVLNSIMKELIVGPGKVGIVEEPVDTWTKFTHGGDQGNPELIGKGLLELSYLKPKIYAGLFQWTAFMSRALLSSKIVPGVCLSLSERSLLSDRAFEKNSVKEGNIDALGDNVYDYLTTGAMEFLKAKPQGLIYVRTDPNICSERIQKRNRTGEGSIPISYLNNLHERHEKWLQPGEETFFFDGKLVSNKISNNTDSASNNITNTTTTSTTSNSTNSVKNLSSVIVPKVAGDAHNLPRIIIDGDLDLNLRDEKWRENLKERIHQLLIVCASNSGMLSNTIFSGSGNSIHYPTNTSRIYRNYASYSSISECCQ